MISYFNTFKVNADIIDNWENSSKSELFFRCRKEKDEFLHDCLFSCLVCKYWYMTTYYYKRGKQYGIDYIDCIDIVTDAILKVLRLKIWDKDSKISKDENGPEYAINQALKTVFLDKVKGEVRRTNRVSNISDEELDHMFEYYDRYYGEESKDIIEKYLDNKEYFKAVVVDGICFQPIVCVENQKFQVSRLISYVKNIDVDETVDYFKFNYKNLDVKSFKDSIDRLASIKERNVRSNVLEIIDSLKSDIKKIDGSLYN